MNASVSSVCSTILSPLTHTASFVKNEFVITGGSIKRIANDGLNSGKEIYKGARGIVIHTAKASYYLFDASLTLLALRVIKGTDRNARFVGSNLQLFEYTIGSKVPAFKTAYRAVEVIKGFVSGRNISERWVNYARDCVQTPWGLKKLSFSIQTIGNLFETRNYLVDMGFGNYLLSFSHVATVHQYANIAANHVGNLQLLGISGNQIGAAAVAIGPKAAKDVFIGLSFAISIVEIIRNLATDDPEIKDDLIKEKMYWTIAEQIGKLSLIVASGSLGICVGFASTTPFMFMCLVVNTISVTKYIRSDMKAGPALTVFMSACCSTITLAAAAFVYKQTV